jgi:7,8-dihydroneopterin aldolase/epimerase/oxygenase
VPQLIRLTGLRVEGRHGAVELEREDPQPFVVDLELVVEPRDDELSTTADYRDVIASVRSLVETESHALIETLAERVAALVAGRTEVRSCRALVHKPAAAERLEVADLSAEARAE